MPDLKTTDLNITIGATITKTELTSKFLIIEAQTHTQLPFVIASHFTFKCKLQI